MAKLPFFAQMNSCGLALPWDTELVSFHCALGQAKRKRGPAIRAHANPVLKGSRPLSSGKDPNRHCRLCQSPSFHISPGYYQLVHSLSAPPSTPRTKALESSFSPWALLSHGDPAFQAIAQPNQAAVSSACSLWSRI